jgi:hypothetical protein
MLNACESDGVRQPVVARVGEEFMTLKELSASIPDNLSAEDSAELATNLIQTWVNRELMYDKARYNLKEEELDIEDRVEQYREELYIFAYEKELVNQKLDTNIDDEEVRQFYEDNPEIFQLNDYILKVRYVKLKLNSPNIAEIETWMQSSDAEELMKLDEYCHKYAVKYYNDSNWVFFNELLRELPIEVYNKESFLRSENLVRFTDPEHLYILWIRDLQSKNTLSPIELEYDRIKGLILNKRRLELKSRIRNRLYQDARSRGNVEVYDKPQLPN